MKSFWIRIFILIILIGVGNAYGENDLNLYKKAKKFTFQRKWRDAIESYEKLIKKYPDSRYADDATFWKAYIFEKQNKNSDAFWVYQQLTKEYPNSPWVDDALIHQILLAEKFVTEGQKNYLEFLNGKLSDTNENVSFQAAISLGKLGNKRALPILKKIAKSSDEDLSKLASSLINTIKAAPSMEKVKDEESFSSDIEILIQAKKEGSLADENSEGDGFWDKMFYETKRYKIYKQLAKKSENWTEIELITYGLWHILPVEEFSEFFLLNNDYDKKEWLRKYWKRWDPTPTTEQNERKDEFMRRIDFAHKQFGKEWDYRHSSYLKEQYLRSGWTMAPWDSRGELYVKYGEPDFKYVEGFIKEEWVYYRYNVDFIVKPYMTNIFGNGIDPGPMCKIMQSDNPSYIDAKFIFNPEFKFDPYKDFEPLKSFKVDFDIKNIKSPHSNIEVVYSFSGDELKINETIEGFLANFQQSYAVYNEDLKEVISKQEEIEILSSSKKDLEKKKRYNINFELNSPPGYYTLAIRINDLNSNKLGLFIKEFNVK